MPAAFATVTSRVFGGTASSAKRGAGILGRCAREAEQVGPVVRDNREGVDLRHEVGGLLGQELVLGQLTEGDALLRAAAQHRAPLLDRGVDAAFAAVVPGQREIQLPKRSFKKRR